MKTISEEMKKRLIPEYKKGEPYDPCKNCKGLQECVMLNVGYTKKGDYYERCRYNQRGAHNNELITRKKFRQWEADNKEEIIAHVNKKHSIYLWGKFGTGKTHFLFWLANKYNLQGHQVYIDLFADISRKLKQEIAHQRSTGEIRVSEVTKMQESELLFIDDIGNEKMSDFIHESLASVINYRYINERPTFITSNYSLKELYNVWVEQIGDVKAGQLVSRIKTFGAIEIKSKNWRNGK